VGWATSPCLVCDASDREYSMALKLEEKKVVVAEVNAVAAKPSPSSAQRTVA